MTKPTTYEYRMGETIIQIEDQEPIRCKSVTISMPYETSEDDSVLPVVHIKAERA